MARRYHTCRGRTIPSHRLNSVSTTVVGVFRFCPLLRKRTLWDLSTRYDPEDAPAELGGNHLYEMEVKSYKCPSRPDRQIIYANGDVAQLCDYASLAFGGGAPNYSFPTQASFVTTTPTDPTGVVQDDLNYQFRGIIGKEGQPYRNASPPPPPAVVSYKYPPITIAKVTDGTSHTMRF